MGAFLEIHSKLMDEGDGGVRTESLSIKNYFQFPLQHQNSHGHSGLWVVFVSSQLGSGTTEVDFIHPSATFEVAATSIEIIHVTSNVFRISKSICPPGTG